MYGTFSNYGSYSIKRNYLIDDKVYKRTYFKENVKL